MEWNKRSTNYNGWSLSGLAGAEEGSSGVGMVYSHDYDHVAPYGSKNPTQPVTVPVTKSICCFCLYKAETLHLLLQSKVQNCLCRVFAMQITRTFFVIIEL
jgi:hypothetical protein